MRINGTEIAQELRQNLKKRTDNLIAKGVTPKIAIITLGPESSWESYVSQKIKVADELGVSAVLVNLQEANQEKLLKTIAEIDSDPKYNGIIVQRPLPTGIDRAEVINAISPQKDIDGFGENSPFEVPVWLAVKRLLEEASFDKSSNFVVLGKGETAGGPIARGLRSLDINPIVIGNQTENPAEILKDADVVISAVGKSRVVVPENLKSGVVLIGVGTHGEEGKIRGDYKANEVKQIAKAYTTTPGGVGPVNLTYLFDNLLTAAENQLDAKMLIK